MRRNAGRFLAAGWRRWTDDQIIARLRHLEAIEWVDLDPGEEDDVEDAIALLILELDMRTEADAVVAS